MRTPNLANTYLIEMHEDIADIEIFSSNVFVRFLQRIGLVKTTTVRQMVMKTVNILNALQ